MAGGQGTRLLPMTKVANKHLLPVYDKPMIYYPLTTLIAAGIEDITLVTNPKDLINFQTLLGDGVEFNCQITYMSQNFPGGIPEGIRLAKSQLNGNKIALILGDNLFIGKGLGRDLSKFLNVNGCDIFGTKVADPSSYGVAILDNYGKVVKLVEKPNDLQSNIAIPGLYFFDETVYEKADSLVKSDRGELEIVDLLNLYLKEKSLKLNLLERGSTWMDCGTPDQLAAASEFVRVLQNRQGMDYGNPKEVKSGIQSS